MRKRKQDSDRVANIESVKITFVHFFNDYYNNHREIKNVSYKEMENNQGYCAVLEYKNFTQYVNYFSDYFSFDKAVVNSCFLFHLNKPFICNFDDVLDMADSDDLSFYTYSNCFKDDAVLSAISNIMSATEKHRPHLYSIASSDFLKKKYIKANFSEDEEWIACVEDNVDAVYFSYKINGDADDYYTYLKKELVKQYRKNQLDTMYEKRAYRVLNHLTKSDIKKLEKDIESANKMSKKDKFLMYLPLLINAVLFLFLFAVIGYKLDEQVFADCVGANHLKSAFGFGIAGVWVSLAVSLLLPNSIYKWIVKKENYDSFIRMVKAQDIQVKKIYRTLIYAFLILACLAAALFFIFVFCFNGIVFNDDAIVYKEYAFSEQQIYSFEDTDIAVVEGSYDSDGWYAEYDETAYAFCLDGEWVEYGVPADEPSGSMIQKNIEKYNKSVRIYQSIRDIE